jgi:hypothetical protein
MKERKNLYHEIVIALHTESSQKPASGQKKALFEGTLSKERRCVIGASDCTLNQSAFMTR